jgi:hypothetical protein
MTTSDDEREAREIAKVELEPLPEPDSVPAELSDIVEEARRYSHFAVRELIKVAQGKGGRGAQARTGAARMLLELARFVGADSEDYEVRKKPHPALASVAPLTMSPEQREALRQELVRRRQQQANQS